MTAGSGGLIMFPPLAQIQFINPTFSTRFLFSTKDPSTALNSRYLVTSVWMSTLTRLPLAWGTVWDRGRNVPEYLRDR